MNRINDKYAQKAADWRGQLKKNSRKTYCVIVCFFLIYLVVGLLSDLLILMNSYPPNNSQLVTEGNVPLGHLVYMLLTLQVFPIATAITLCIAVISLLVTFLFYKRLVLLGTQYRAVDIQNPKGLQEQQLVNVLTEMKVAAGLSYMPKLYIIEADYMNAFASGYSEKTALIAVTQGLLNKLNREELAAVLAHELSHVRHLDIKLTLIASMLANLILIVMDILFWSIIFGGNRNSNRGNNNIFFIILILRYLLPLITMLLLLFLSRTREYMADAGAVELMRNNEPLARALLKIQGDYVDNETSFQAQYKNTAHEQVRQQAYIFDPTKAGFKAQGSWSDLFSTHPSIQKRLKALGFTRTQQK